ncbi:MAG: hypothetical protein JSV79_12050 [Armatimonadota bacterium]|nr:MAG: hypothetical protein JSV79_12050 [Armatimonadota bacterium]
MPDTTDKSATRLVLVAGAATVGLGVALSGGWEPGIPGEWVWEHNALGAYLLPALVAALLLVPVGAVLCRSERWSRMPALGRGVSLAALVLLVLALQWALLTAVGPPSVSWSAPGWIIASPNATTYFSASLDVRDVKTWIAEYPQHMSKLPHHAQTHPPGFVLLFVLLRRAAAAMAPGEQPVFAALAESYNETFGLGLTPTDAVAAVAGAAIIALAGALSLIPLYLLGRELVGAKGAVCAVGLAAGMPGLLLLGASGDQIILLLAVLTAWLCYSGWRRQSVVGALLAGLTAAVGLFLSLGFAVVAAWLAVWVVLGALRSENPRAAFRRAVISGATALVGFAILYLLLYSLLGYRPLAVAQQAFAAHRDVTTVAVARSYWKWLLMNPLEAAMFTGFPLVIAALWSRPTLSRDAASARLRSFLAAWLIVLVVLNLSGAVRGEVGRIWLFLFWPAALAAGAWLASRPRLAAAAPVLVLLQVSQVFLMRGYLTIYSIL